VNEKLYCKNGGATEAGSMTSVNWCIVSNQFKSIFQRPFFKNQIPKNTMPVNSTDPKPHTIGLRNSGAPVNSPTDNLNIELESTANRIMIAACR
jgi:hypothetical protein